MKLPTRDLRVCLENFSLFYDLLMKEAPEGYLPWFFPCAKNGKHPSTEAILKLDNTSKGSWHHEGARLTKEKALALIRQGYNIGISAREGDPLIIIDIDEHEFLKQLPKGTLTTTSRKRAGAHAFCWDLDGSAKINLPTDYGEVRSKNQYVLASGCFVQFNVNNEKDKKAYDKLPDYAKNDNLLGCYTLRDKNTPKKIGFDGLPDFFKNKEKENLVQETKIKQREEKNSYENGKGKYTELFKLKVCDLVEGYSSNTRKGHPLHESDTDSNFSLSKDGSLGQCWRHMVSLNAVQFLCVKSGYSKCEDAGTPHKGRGFSKIKGDKKALEVAYEEALKNGFISEWKGRGEKKGNILYDKISQVQIFHEENTFFYDRNNIWWLWNRTKFRYEKSDEVDILGISYETENNDIVNSKERRELINSLKHVGRQNIPQEPKDSWVQFRDNIVDLQTGEQFEATPKYFITNPIPWSLGETEETPSFDKLFSDWVGEENIKELYEIIAFAQAPKYFIHRIFCLIGSGANGKSTFLTILRKYLHDDNVVSSSLDSLMKMRFEGSKLYKKLVCLMGETNFGTLTQTDYIKGLSGEDKLRIEFKGKDGFDAVNYAKLILATNSLPATADKTDGFYRRWKIVNFNNKFKKEKDVLSEIPQEEYKNLARKLLRILKELWINRVFTNDGNFEDRKAKYEEHSNPLNLFINERFERDINFDYSSTEFRIEFLEFLQEKGARELTSKVITQQLNNLGFEVKQMRIEGVSQKGIRGIKRKNVSLVSDVSGISVRSFTKSLNETPETSETSETLQGKPNNSDIKDFDNLMNQYKGEGLL